MLTNGYWRFIFDHKFYTEHELIVNLLASMLVIITIALLRGWYIKALPDALTLSERRQRIVSLRNRVYTVGLILLIALWGTELKTLAVSLLAIAVALVVATKEVIIIVIGGVILATTKRYSVGSRIEVKSIRGDVIDISLMYTTIMELGPGAGTQQYTGKAVAIPNSAVLTETVIVDTIANDHALHNIKVPVAESEDINAKAELLQRIAERACHPYQENAHQELSKWERDTAINLLSSQPRVVISADDSGRWWLVLRFVIPLKNRLVVEQEILRSYLSDKNTAPSRINV